MSAKSILQEYLAYLTNQSTRILWAMACDLLLILQSEKLEPIP